MSFLKQYYKKQSVSAPVYHFVLGSGYSDFVDEVAKHFTDWEEKPPVSFKEMSQIPLPTVISHKGIFRFFVHKPTGKSLVFQCGRLHLYEGHSPLDVVQPVIQSYLSGVKNFVITNIAGGLKKEHRVGTVIAIKDHVNRTHQSPLVGFSLKDEKGELLGAKFPDMQEAYNPLLKKELTQELLSSGLQVKEGVYVGLLGPELETPAEIAWLNTSSAGLFDAVGMSTVLEVIALRQAQAVVSGFSLISNPASGIDPEHKELSAQDMFLAVQPYVKKMIESFFKFSEKKFKTQGK